MSWLPGAVKQAGPVDGVGPLRVLALAGGVGGAKLAAGLSCVLQDRLTVMVNTGDDFEHLGVRISPDVDTVVYTLGAMANAVTGWGVAGETWNFMEQVKRLGGPGWFLLGDRDLAMHVTRTERLRQGHSLTEVTSDACAVLGIKSRVLPMTDDVVRTKVHSGTQVLDFQHYFVRDRCMPEVSGLSFEGASVARFNAALHDLEGGDGPLVVVICPSNPYLSIDPMLALPGFRDWLARVPALRLAVSPIVGGDAIKGPVAKMMREMGIEVTAESIAMHYRGLVDGFIFDEVDQDLVHRVAALGMAPMAVPTVMNDSSARIRLAQDCITIANRLLQRNRLS